MKTLQIVLPLLFIISCSAPTVTNNSGSGTNIGNAAIGFVVSKDGNPVNGAIVKFVPEQMYGTVELLSDTLKDTTGSDGKYQIPTSEKFGTILVEDINTKNAAIAPIETSNKDFSITIQPRTTLKVSLSNRAAGTMKLLGTTIQQSITEKDSVVEISEVPAGNFPGIHWTPTGTVAPIQLIGSFSSTGTPITVTLTGGTVTVRLYGAGRSLRGTLRIEGTEHVAAINPNDSLVTFTNIPYGTKTGILWHPEDSPTTSYIIATSFSVSMTPTSLLYPGVGRWHKLSPTDTVTQTLLAPNGVLWCGIQGKGLQYMNNFPKGTWTQVTDLPKVTNIRSIIADGNKIIVAFDSLVYSGNELSGFSKMTLPAGITDIKGLAADDGNLAIMEQNKVSIIRGGNSQTVTSATKFTGVVYREKNVSVSTLGKGLLIITPTDTIRKTTASGIPSDTILSLSSSQEGLIIHTTKNFYIEQVGSWLSFPVSKPYRTFYCENKDLIWYAGDKFISSTVANNKPVEMGLTPEDTLPYPNFGSATKGLHGGVILGAIGGVRQLP